MQNKNGLWVLLVAGLVANFPSLASTAEEIKDLNEKNLVLQARLKNAELELQISKKEADTASSKRPPPSMDVRVDPESSAPLPVVRSIEGYAGKMKAVLAFSGNESIVATEGSSVPGGWTVTKISENSVLLKRKNKTTELRFGYAPESSRSFGPGSGMPPGFNPANMPMNTGGFPPASMPSSIGGAGR